MKIAFPTNGTSLDSEIFLHFGKCINYLIYNTENNEYQLIKNTSDHMGGTGLPPELLKKIGADIMIVSDLGTKALELFNNLGIEVYSKAQGKIKDILDEYNNNKLLKADINLTCEGV